MTQEEFVIFSLKELQVPLVTPTGKDIVLCITKGYRVGGYSAQGLSKFTKKYFSDKPKGQPILTYLYNINEVSCCLTCKAVKPKNEFTKDKTSGTKVNSYCKPCNSLYRKDNVDTVYYNAKRRAEIQQAIPPWANLNKIKQIYKNRPEGYHVDHIYPLNGPNICGLHVENNLQYLTASENLSKSNKVP